MDERLAVERRLRELDRLGEDLDAIDRLLCESVLHDDQLKRLLTITGVDCIVAIGLPAAIGDICRFATPTAAKPVCSLGLASMRTAPHARAPWLIVKVGVARNCLALAQPVDALQ